MRRRGGEKRVIITGDDLGLSAENNAGIITAHLRGRLSTTCLMVGGDAVEEALDIARSHPTLAVGLHISFNDTRPILPPESVSLLVDTNGRFPPDDHAHRRALYSVKGRQQLRAEIAAQCRAFYATKLPWDHINTHRHAHRHPLLAIMLFREAARWPVRTTRIPWNPPANLAYIARNVLLRSLSAANRLRAPERSIGEDWSPDRLVEVLRLLPDGVTELYFHPITMTEHRYAADLPTLLDDKVQAAMAQVTACSGLSQACGIIPARFR